MPTTLAKIYNKCHNELLCILAPNNTNSSFVFSPYSINFAMLMAYAGMDNDTKEEFEKVYCFTSTADVLNKMYDFNKLINHDDLRTANALFLEQSYSINDKFKENVVNRFDLDFKMSDFKNNSEGERQIINNWVEEKTNKFIKNMINKNVLNNTVKLVLVNTIFLKMKWVLDFKKYSDSFEFTKNDDNKTTVSSMYFKTPNLIQYYNNYKYHILSLPYANVDKIYNGYSMIIIFCKETDWNNKFTNLDICVLDKLELTKVQLYMPKFTTEYNIELVPIFEQMGLKLPFDEMEADFNKLTNTNDIYISNVIHKVKIEVDELGTEAAAATAIVKKRKCRNKGSDKNTKKIVLNHTFQYFITHDKSKTILFSGVYNGD
jgi:serine protease inhibitor